MAKVPGLFYSLQKLRKVEKSANNNMHIFASVPLCNHGKRGAMGGNDCFLVSAAPILMFLIILKVVLQW